MKKFKVVITETVEYRVEAGSEHEALQAAKSLRAYDYAEGTTLVSGPTTSYTIGECARATTGAES